MSDKSPDWTHLLESKEPEAVLNVMLCEYARDIDRIKGYAGLILADSIDSKEAAEVISQTAEQMRILRTAVLDYLERRHASQNHDGA
jgi:hypothetical protein